jgi:hypothetical protein
MIKQFEVVGGTHFRTYALERNGSISANCNVLNALLHCEQPNQYIPQIIKTTKYLCKSWAAGTFADKWVMLTYLPTSTPLAEINIAPRTYHRNIL